MKEPEMCLPAVPQRSTLSVCSKGLVLNWDSLMVKKQQRGIVCHVGIRCIFHIKDKRNPITVLKRLCALFYQNKNGTVSADVCWIWIMPLPVNGTGISRRLSQQPYVLRCPLPYSSSAFYFWLSVSVSPVAMKGRSGAEWIGFRRDITYPPQRNRREI